MQNKNKSTKITKNKYPESIKKSVIYEVNIRQYTPEGTIKAFIEHIPRLSELGVDILWLMPVQPIGKKNRKGELGSYYSIKNYTEVNPKFGTKKDLKKLIKEAHKNRMKVLLDWVANHTSWDNIWIKKNPQWYKKDKKGKIIPPNKDWKDVAALNYKNQNMRAQMINSMKYWLKNFDIDGFRCDMAKLVPTDFWEQARNELEKIKPVFMLAEAENSNLMKKAFDMNYSWVLLHLTEDIAQKKKKAVDLIDYFLDDSKNFSQNTIRMVFTSNHDENSWNGSVYDRYPNCHKTFAAFTFVIPGMPLIYSGQEACLNKKINFFSKDTIEWKNCDMTDLYKNLIKLKKENKALWNKPFGSNLEFAPTKTNENITTFLRKKDNNKILCLFNLSDKKTNVEYIIDKVVGKYKDFFSNKLIKINKYQPYELEPWDFKILIATN